MVQSHSSTFIGLNAVRVLSIIALFLICASNIETIVSDVRDVNRFYAAGKSANSAGAGSNNATRLSADYILGSTVPNEPAGPFWAVLNRLLIVGQTVLLILSELGFPAAFLNHYFPVLGDDFGVGALGIMQMLIGAAVLSHHTDTFTLVCAFFLFSIGCLNGLVGLIWREQVKAKRSVSSWRDRAKKTAPSTTVTGVNLRPLAPSAAKSSSSSMGGPTSTDCNSNLKSDSDRTDQSLKKAPSLGFGRQAEKAAAMKGYLITKPVEALPRYILAKMTHTGSTELSSTSPAVA